MAITISANQSRLVRSQGALQQEIGRALQSRLGWQVSGAGAAHLALVIHREAISTAARASDNSPTRYQLGLEFTATFSRPPHEQSDMLSQRFSAVGYADGRLGEPAALQEAAEIAARNLTDWLEREAQQWQQAPPTHAPSTEVSP